MANKLFTQKVEMMCKTIWKTTWKFCVNLCVKFSTRQIYVYKTFIPPTFPTLPTNFSSNILLRSNSRFSTIPHSLLLQQLLFI